MECPSILLELFRGLINKLVDFMLSQMWLCTHEKKIRQEKELGSGCGKVCCVSMISEASLKR